MLIVSGVLNLAIDPYDVYDTPKISGFNAKKTKFSSHLRFAKAFKIYHIQPTAIALGNSRAEYGITMDHPGWSNSAIPRYNLALSGANIFETRSYFEHAHGISPLRQAILMLDFLQFNANRENKTDFDPSILSQHGGQIINAYHYALSITQIKDSLKTILHNNTSHNNYRPYLSSGQRDPEYKIKTISEQGQFEAFLNTEKHFINGVYANYTFLYPSGNSTLDRYRAIIKVAQMSDIDLSIAISPSHARQWEALDVAAGWKKFEYWKRELVHINESVALSHGKQPFALWDFSGYHAFTTEPVPPKGDKTTMMKWHWESSHYRKELGDIMLDRIFETNAYGGQNYPDFGVLMTSKNIDAHLQKLRKERAQWQAVNPETIKLIQSLKD